MFEKSRTFVGENNCKGRNIISSLMILLVVVSFCVPYTVTAQDEECDTSLTYHSDTNRLCVPSIETENDYVIDGDKSDWVSGNYYLFNEYTGVMNDVTVLVSHKKVSLTQVDLYLFFEVGTDDAVATSSDEIRIGLNPSDVSSNNNTLIIINPWDPGLSIEVFDYNSGTSTWVASSAAWLTGNVAVSEDALNETWSVEMKIPLYMAPNPITGTDFRLYMELHADDGVTPIVYAWPPHYTVGTHNYICVNPERWHPMSFGTGCYADLNIAGGSYSCNDIYVLRGGTKSTEIRLNSMNEIHADVTGDPSKNAADVQVYLTLLKFGIGTGPVAMNYDANDTNIKNWFQEHWGSWLLATDSLDTGTPRPTSKFNVNAGTVNTDARFNWKPADETRFGTDAQKLTYHDCIGAFVDYENDPNMADNFSNCNMQIVDATSGKSSAYPFWVGPYFAYAPPQGIFNTILLINAYNEPYEGWFEESKVYIRGEGVKAIGKNLFGVTLPREGEIPLYLVINPPAIEVEGPGYYLKGSTGGLKGSKMLNYSTTGLSDIKSRPNPEPKPKKALRVRNNSVLENACGERPTIVVQGLVSAGYKTLGGERVQLYRPTSYATYCLNLKDGRPRPFEVFVFAGWTIFDDTLGLNDGIVVGGKLGYKLINQLVLELEGGVTLTDNIAGVDGKVIQAMGNLRYEFPLGLVTPYVTAGAGYAMFKGFGVDDEALAVQGGIGATLKLNNSFGLRAEGRMFRVGDVWNVGTTTNYQITGGFVYWF